MKRFHVHVAVEDISRSTGVFSTLFGAAPVVRKDDDARWMPDDPKVTFAICTRTRTAGVDHLGIQVESGEELAELAGRLEAAGQATRDQEAAACGYARSDKLWVNDPTAIRWETFFTFGEAIRYDEDEPDPVIAAPTQGCCG